MRLKILTVVGTRPEIIRLSCIIKKLNISFNHKIINTNQNFDPKLNSNFFKELGIGRPAYNLKCGSNSAIQFVSKLLKEFDKVLDNEKPDAVLVLGDTNSALSVICAKKRKIPIFHIEAGNRCFDQRVPEEVNRKIVDHISDINLTYSSYASENLILEGISKDRIIKIGSPLYEVYEEYSTAINKSKILEKINIKKNNFILVSLHRQENLEDVSKLRLILTAIIRLKKKLKMPVIFSTHPRTKKIIRKFNQLFFEQINFCQPFSFFDYAKMMKNSRLVISDSGSITEETSILSIPSINLRSTNERQEGMEIGTVIMSGLKLDDILNSCNIALKRAQDNFQLETFLDYKNKNVSDTVVTVIQSYTHYINSKFWFK